MVGDPRVANEMFMAKYADFGLGRCGTGVVTSVLAEDEKVFVYPERGWAGNVGWINWDVVGAR